MRAHYDFRTMKRIGQDINANDPGIEYGNGFDHNFVLRGSAPVSRPALAATVVEPSSGRKMEIYTTEPGIQFYTANHLDGSVVGRGGRSYPKNGALCLEAQHFPDSPNHLSFPSTVLIPGQEYRQTTVHKFSTVE